MDTTVRQLFLAASMVLLTACGGTGSTDDSNTRPIQLSSTNARGLAINTYILAPLTLSAQGITNTTFGIADADETGGNGTPAPAPQPNLTSVTTYIEPGALASKTEENINACPGGGTETITIVDNGPEEEFNSGDSATIIYDNCLDDTILTDGDVSMLINSIGENSAEVTFAYNNLIAETSSDTLNFNGNVIIDYFNNSSTETETTSFTSTALTITYNGSVLTFSDYNFTITESDNQETNSLDYFLTTPAGSVTVTTNPVFQRFYAGNSECATMGAMTIVGANGTSILLDANTGNTDTFLMTVNDGVATTTEFIDCDDLLAPFDQDNGSSMGSTSSK